MLAWANEPCTASQPSTSWGYVTIYELVEVAIEFSRALRLSDTSAISLLKGTKLNMRLAVTELTRVK